MKTISEKQQSFHILKETYDLQKIKESIPIIRNLHHSFWEDTQFLTWQIVRLNREYQELVVRLWGNADLLGNNAESLYVFFTDHPPEAQEPFDDWKERFPDENFEYLPKFASCESKSYKDFFDSFPKYSRFRFSPIPHCLRFPLPTLLGIFPYLCVGRRYFRPKGRPQDWATNLLVYELRKQE